MSHEPIGFTLCGGDDHNDDECKRFAGEREAIKTLLRYASGEIGHQGLGLCPDDLEGHDSRDPECTVCLAMVALAAAQPAPVVPEGYVLVPEKKETGKWESARIGDFNAGWNACRDSVVSLLEKAAWMELDTTKRSIAIQDEMRAMLAVAPAAPAQGQQVECQECERLREEVAELDALRQRQSDLLSETAIAVRGPEPALTRYSHADIPSRVKVVVDELAALKAQQAEQKPKQDELLSAFCQWYRSLHGYAPYHPRGSEGVEAFAAGAEWQSTRTAPRPAPAQDVADDLRFLADYVWRSSCGHALPNYLALGRFPLDVAKAALAARDKHSGVKP
jgi:hypothetical protein